MRYYGVQNEVKSYLNRLQSEEGIEVSLGTVKTLNDRVEALKKSGVWSQYGLGFNDGDADRYFQRATVRDAIGRFEVCLFVRGMKTLGLWQNMVSWPMRSYQNAGTTTAYSLGGLGTFNGTLENGPTWGADGMTFDGTNDYINAPSVNFPASFTFFLTHKNNAGAKATKPIIGTIGGTSQTNMYFGHTETGTLYGVVWAQATGQQLPYNSTIASPALGSFESAAFGYILGSSDFTKNGGSFSTRVSDPTTALVAQQKTLQIGGNTQNANYFNGQIPFVSLISQKITETQHTALYTLYKSTLGSSLALP